MKIKTVLNQKNLLKLLTTASLATIVLTSCKTNNNPTFEENEESISTENTYIPEEKSNLDISVLTETLNHPENTRNLIEDDMNLENVFVQETIYNKEEDYYMAVIKDYKIPKDYNKEEVIECLENNTFENSNFEETITEDKPENYKDYYIIDREVQLTFSSLEKYDDEVIKSLTMISANNYATGKYTKSQKIYQIPSNINETDLNKAIEQNDISNLNLEVKETKFTEEGIYQTSMSNIETEGKSK